MTNNGEGSVSDVIAGRAQWCVVHGNSWRVRRSLPSGCVDVDLMNKIIAEEDRQKAALKKAMKSMEKK